MSHRRKKLITIVIFTFYLLGLLMATEAVLRARTAQGAIAWSVSLTSFPVLSVPAYLVFGRSKFKGMADAFAARKNEFEVLLNEIEKNLVPFEVLPSEGPSWHEAMISLSGRRLTQNNHVDLLIDGDATFDSIERGIALAKEYIFFQFYIIRDDKLGNRLKKALIERSKAGVRVYVLYDEIGSYKLSSSYINELRKSGVKVHSFNTSQGKGNRFQLNFRNHRKVVVVDGKFGWLGGHNVGDEYLGSNPVLSPWRDTHVTIEGPSVIQLQMTFLSDWYWAVRELPEGVNWKPHKSDNGSDKVMIFPFSPTNDYEDASLFFTSLLNAAKKRVWLSAPYFVPDSSVMTALKLAALRGVDVRILLNSKNDNFIAQMASYHYINELKNTNIHFYAFKNGFLHEKVVLVDDSISTVGTPNFDNRSFRLNFEITAVVADKGLAQNVEKMFLDDFKNSNILKPQCLIEKPYWWWVVVKFSRLLSPVL